MSCTLCRQNYSYRGLEIMPKKIINLLKSINFIKGKFIKYLLILMIATMSKNAFGFGFVSLGSLTDGNQGYYLEYGIPIFFMPVGLHYESGDKRPSLFTGLLLPSCFIDAMRDYMKWSSLCAQKNKGLWQKFGVAPLAGCRAVVTGSCLDIPKNVKTATPRQPLQAQTDPTIMLRRKP